MPDTDNAVSVPDRDNGTHDSEVEQPDSDTSIPDLTSDQESADEDTNLTVCHTGDFPDTCGVWAVKMMYSIRTKVLGFDLVPVTNWTLIRATHTNQVEGKIEIAWQECHVVTQVDENWRGLVNLEYPPSFDKAIREHVEARTAELEKHSDGTYGYHQELKWQFKSVASDIPDPASYELPVSTDDARVVDWDNDEIGGLKVIIKGTAAGFVEIVQKASSEFWGQIEGTGPDLRIDGGFFSARNETAGSEKMVNWTDSQKNVYADNPALKTATVNVMDKNGPYNYWGQVRIPDDADCDWIVANEATLFPIK